MTCASLKMVYGCSHEKRLGSFREIGYTELLPLLVQVLSITDMQAGSSHAILQALHVIRVFSKLEAAKPYLVQSTSLLGALVQVIWSFESNDGTNWIVLDKDAESIQVETMGIIKDLTFRTLEKDKLVVYNAKGVVPTLLHFGRKSEARRIREYVAAIWWNLAMSSNVGQEMANNVEILTSLHNLMQSEDTAKTRRNAISSVGNLATVAANHEQLLSHQEGTLIQQIQTAAKVDDDTDTRRRAMRTLRCLCSGEAAHTLRRQVDFCEFLAKVAQNDVDRDTRVQALECMAYVVGDNEAMDVVGNEIKAALIGTIENSNESRLTIDACKSLSACLSRAEPSDADRRTDLSTTLYAKLASAVAESTDPTAHQIVASFVAHVMASKSSSAKVPTPVFLKLLAALLSPVGPDFEPSQSIAMTTIHSLVDVDSNKRALAEDEGLLTALVNYAMVTTETAKKDEAKSLILKLIPEL